MLDEHRALAAGAGLYFRPRLEAGSSPAKKAAEAVVVLADESSVPQQQDEPRAAYTPTDIAYLRTSRGQQGVFQVHEAACPEEMELLVAAS